MRKRVAWPGVAVKSAKGRHYHYWTRTNPWTRLPDPMGDPDGFMRKLAHLQRLALRDNEAKTGTLANTIRLYKMSPDFTGCAESTRDTYSIYLDRLPAIFPDAQLAEITRPLVQRFVMDENADTPGAANMMRRVLHLIYKWAAGRKDGLRDPTQGIKPFDGKPHEPWPEHLLLAALQNDDAHFRTAVALHYFTGQRTGDTCSMTWNAITAAGRIPVIQQKTGTSLLIPIHDDLAKALAEAPRGALTMLTNRQGLPLKPQTFGNWVTKFGAQHNTHLVPHGLRKNAVIAMLEAGCSVAEVSAVTGQSLQMVEHYAKGRNQERLSTVTVMKWNASGTRGAAQTANGKTFPNIENRASNPLKPQG